MQQLSTRVKEIFFLILENPPNMLQFVARVKEIFFIDFRKSTKYAAS